MDVFDLHRHLIGDYASYTRSFIRIADKRIHDEVENAISAGLLWPEPLLQLNPSFEPGAMRATSDWNAYNTRDGSA
jgi:hypothetical protein